MSLYQHELFTIDLNKIIAVNQEEDETTITIRTDDQRKIEVGAESPEAAVELLNDLAAHWEKGVGPLLRHERHVFLTSAMYSIQVEGSEVSIYFSDHSVSFETANAEAASALLAELSRRWEAAVAVEATR